MINDPFWGNPICRSPHFGVPFVGEVLPGMILSELELVEERQGFKPLPKK